MLDRIAPYYKAVTGLLIPFLTSIGAALLESSDGGVAITAHEWITSTVVALIAGGAVFAVPNKDPQALHQDESVQPPELGAIDSSVVVTLAAVVVILCGLVWLFQAL